MVCLTSTTSQLANRSPASHNAAAMSRQSPPPRRAALRRRVEGTSRKGILPQLLHEPFQICARCGEHVDAGAVPCLPTRPTPRRASLRRAHGYQAASPPPPPPLSEYKKDFDEWYIHIYVLYLSNTLFKPGSWPWFLTFMTPLSPCYRRLLPKKRLDYS